MKRYFWNTLIFTAVCTVVLFTATETWAQRGGRGGGDRRGGDRAERMKEMQEKRFAELVEFLGLDEEQTAKAKELSEAQREKGKALMEEARSENADREQMREKMQVFRDEFHAELKKILNTDQQAKLDEWIENHQPGQRGGGEGPPPQDN